MKIGYLQFEPRLGEPELNRARLAEFLAGRRAELVVLPELAVSGYCLEPELLARSAEPAAGPTTELLTALARETGAHYVCGLAERDGDTYYNSAVLVGPDGLVDRYRKLHLFGFEDELFQPGNEPPRSVSAAGAELGLMICFDWIYPETMRCLALEGARVVCHPANLVLPHCPRAMLTRCLENRVFAVTANRTGSEFRRGEELRFIGSSQIVAPDGSLLHRAPTAGESLHLLEIDPAAADDKTVASGNDIFAERRPQHYGRLCTY
jgi:predicted amidohydrolase